jgi:hypothetical protein
MFLGLLFKRKHFRVTPMKLQQEAVQKVHKVTQLANRLNEAVVCIEAHMHVYIVYLHIVAVVSCMFTTLTLYSLCIQLHSTLCTCDHISCTSP